MDDDKEINWTLHRCKIDATIQGGLTPAEFETIKHHGNEL